MSVPSLKTVKNVPIVSTGTYPLGSGEHTFTEADLAGAVAAQFDPAVQTPRLKIGHTDPRFDGEPCFGKVENMRLDDNGQTIYADLVGVPEWLADIMPTAYPSRSIEAFMNVTLSTGKQHEMVITALSLLGLTLPGVETLDDLPHLFGAEQPAELEIKAGTKLTATIEGKIMEEIRASINVEDIRRAYYDTLTSDQSWWWVRNIYMNPNELIVDDDEGNLYRVPFEVGTNDEVSFGDATSVKMQFVDASKSKVEKKSDDREVAVFASRNESRPNKEANMLEKIKAKLGLGAEASEDEVLASLEELQSEDETTVPEVETDDKSEEVESEDEGSEPVEASKDAVVIDRATLEQLKSDAAQGVEARREQVSAKHERILDEAIKAGKIIPARKAHFASLLERDPQGTEDYIEKLEAGAVPVSEIGTSAEASVEASMSYPQEWLPELNKNSGSAAIEKE